MSRSANSAYRRETAWRQLRAAAIVLLGFGVITGCGGSSDESTATPADDASAAGTSGSDDSDANAGGEGASGNYARVTIGAETFEIPPDGLNLCNSLDNFIFGSFAIAADGSAAQAGSPDAATQVNFGVPVANWEEEGLQAPIVNLDLLDEGVRWFASIDRGLGSVDSWELAGGMATGQATFEAEEAGSGDIVGSETGSFEIVCR